MHGNGKHDRQPSLPFAEGEAARAERLNDIQRACKLADSDLHLFDLVKMVFFFTDGGTRGEVIKTYAELAERSNWGLWCDVSKARRTVSLAIEKGLLIVKEHRRRDGSQAGNSYAIDWEGIRQRIGHLPPLGKPKTASLADVQYGQGAAQYGQPPAHSEQGAAHSEQHLRNSTSSSLLFKTHDDDVVCEEKISEEVWNEARDLARETDGILFPPPHLPGRRLPHRDFLLASSVLALLRFDRHWLLESARATKHRNNVRDKISFLRGVLRRKLHGLTFDGLLCSEETIDAVWNRLFVPLEKQAREFYAARETTQEQPV